MCLSSRCRARSQTWPRALGYPRSAFLQMLAMAIPMINTCVMLFSDNVSAAWIDQDAKEEESASRDARNVAASVARQ